MSGARVLRTCARRLLAAWRLLDGDTAYRRYVAHWQAHHADDGPPPSRAAFYREETARRWSGVRRCC